MEKKINDKNFPNLVENVNLDNQEKTWIPGRINTNGTEPWQKVFILLYTKDKTKNLKAGREKKRHITCRRAIKQMMADLSSKTTDIRIIQ